MIKNLFIIYISLAFLSACGTPGDPEPDDEIVGTWSDEIVTYTFESDQSYEKEILIDNPLDTANLVNTFGNYYSDKPNRVISFTITGFILENGVILDSTTIGPTWIYEITENSDGEVIMNYQSNTTIGTLIKLD